MKAVIQQDNLQELIFLIRGQKVMLDRDLAMLYGVQTGDLNQAVKRNRKRFPEDFMFQLNQEETKNWISQIVISKPALKKSVRRPPYAFTEQGVAMLSSVLKSGRAIDVNIMIMRAFARLRQLVSLNRALAKRLAAIERKLAGHDVDVQYLYQIIKDMNQSPQMEGIGFRLDPEK